MPRLTQKTLQAKLQIHIDRASSALVDAIQLLFLARDSRVVDKGSANTAITTLDDALALVDNVMAKFTTSL